MADFHLIKTKINVACRHGLVAYQHIDHDNDMSCASHVDTIISHVDIDMLHVNIFILHFESTAVYDVRHM